MPLQSAIFADMSGDLEEKEPFPENPVIIAEIKPEITVINSYQHPKKITFIGNDGKEYIFLCKPNDDLRKDARVMEFSLKVNRLLKKDPKANKHNLRIRTYAVIPLDEKCGMIEWVPNMEGLRPILQKIYKGKGICFSSGDLKKYLDKKDPSVFSEYILKQ